MSTSTLEYAPSAREVTLSDAELIVRLGDGRTVSAPLNWFPRLLKATPEQRKNFELIGDGEGIHWPDVDEDLSIAGLLRGVRAPGGGVGLPGRRAMERTPSRGTGALPRAAMAKVGDALSNDWRAERFMAWSAIGFRMMTLTELANIRPIGLTNVVAIQPNAERAAGLAFPLRKNATGKRGPSRTGRPVGQPRIAVHRRLRGLKDVA